MRASLTQTSGSPIRFTTLAILLVAGAALTGCPEAEEKRQEAVDDVGGAAGRQVQQAEARVNAAAKKAAARLEAATADTEKADEGGW